jgi:hypothetical protein
VSEKSAARIESLISPGMPSINARNTQNHIARDGEPVYGSV